MWQKSNNQCPICNCLLSELHDYMDNLLMEHHQECDNCKNYFYSYVTGSTQVLVGSGEWIWSYNTSQEEIKKIQADIDSAIDKIRSKA